MTHLPPVTSSLFSAGPTERRGGRCALTTVVEKGAGEANPGRRCTASLAARPGGEDRDADEEGYSVRRRALASVASRHRRQEEERGRWHVGSAPLRHG